tara:strand:- start:925 stop:1836 length:912 start_codon:yes stop_codon:yes gene_type:complete
MIEYIIIIFLGVIAVLAYLIYQKVNAKEDNTVLSNIDTKLQTIAETKKTMENLQGDMVDFKNLFNNRSERGKFGEEYLEDLVRDALNTKHYKFQHTLSNGKRPDCFLTFGSPEESVCIDSKFSWENYKKMHEEKDQEIRKTYAKAFREDIMQHIKDISEKYIITGETAPLALMFVAAEEVFRDISKHPFNFIKKAREKNVVVVSPDTIFGFLRTYRLLIQNREMYILSGIIQKEVSALDEDIGRLAKRITDADTKHSQISELFRQSRTSVEKIKNHSSKIVNLELDQNKKIDEIDQDNPNKLN